MTLCVTRTHGQCGMREIWNLEKWGNYTGEKFLKEFWDKSDDISWHRRFKFAYFSHHEPGFEMCDMFKKYIEDNKLGTVYVTETHKNPNSDYLIRVYLWDIDWKAVEAKIESFKPTASSWVRSKIAS